MFSIITPNSGPVSGAYNSRKQQLAKSADPSSKCETQRPKDPRPIDSRVLLDKDPQQTNGCMVLGFGVFNPEA